VRPSALIALAACLALGAASCGTHPGEGAVRTQVPPHTTDQSAASPTKTGPLRFTTPEPLAHGSGISSLSCPSTTFCIALGADGDVYHFDGTRWTGPIEITSQRTGPGTVSVSCASSTFCGADPTGGNEVVMWNGAVWSSSTTLTGAHGIEAVGCALTGYCAAVDGEGNAFAYDGQTWHSTSGDWGAVSSISCVSSSFCMSSSGGLSQWNGTGWTTPDTFGAASSFAGVSCPTTSFCVAVDDLGEVLQWNGQVWSAPTRIEPEQSSGTMVGTILTSISCPTTSFCVAVDDAGGILQWSAGSTWSRTDADDGHPLSAVSCATVFFCVAVDQEGNFLVGGPSPGGLVRAAARG